MRLEDLNPGAVIRGILPNQSVKVIDVKWFGADVVQLFYSADDGRTGNELLYRDNEASLQLVQEGAHWSFTADGDALRLVSEAYRIRLAYLFDPYLAVHSSLVEPLPHQISAVYGEMLPRQPLRFLLADDPGAGKTIMAGLLIKELMVRGDLERCLIICPGSLSEQWQDELYEKFSLHFNLMSREMVENSPTGNPFLEQNCLIARLDQLSRNEELQEKLNQSNWDLVICDEAHKMSASYFGKEVRYTKRYHLGRLVSSITRNFLLMTATPHNGKEEDFQLFMALLDGDRFEGKFRDGVHQADTSDLMRRMVKEKLLKFDGTPLFPERKAYTISYTLSDPEAALYKSVTEYVRTEFNRADQIENGGRKGTVGFALTVLQRRLASSPEAIYQSLHRRRKRLEDRLKEEELMKREGRVARKETPDIYLTEEDLEDLDDAPDSEIEEAEEQIVDLATASLTIEELRAEIETLKHLESQADLVRKSGTDRKWDELSNLLSDNPVMYDSSGSRRKIVIFTEHKDTLSYLVKRISTLTGHPEGIVQIHGGLGREHRRISAHRFTQEKDTHILIATDAAGEGINLQRAHLMVNYDLPWNPNRLEQRFGRIHRIGQTEVCHLWNLVAGETREGQVFERLCEKIDKETEALHGQVFDVLGQAFGNKSLRELLMEAIRYGERPDVKEYLTTVIDKALDHERLLELIEEQSLAHDVMDSSKLQRIREDMERNDARRLQPHFIQSFFVEAFTRMGGRLSERENNRFEIKHVPAVIRERDRQIGNRNVVLSKYERITFQKDLIRIHQKPQAEFVCPGHPLLNAVIDLVLERDRGLLKQGAVLIDPNDPEEDPRALFYVEHMIRDARTDDGDSFRSVSKRLQFTEIKKDHEAINAGYAPYLDYRPTTEDERVLLESVVGEFGQGESLEQMAMNYAIQYLVPSHVKEVKVSVEKRANKTITAVRDRLTKEINYWDHRAQELKLQEQTGKVNARLNSKQASDRADKLQGRLKRRIDELEKERMIAALAPNIVGGALIVPMGLLARLKGERNQDANLFANEKKRVELLGMKAVTNLEKRLGNEPRDVSHENLGWDIESKDGQTGRLRFIEVKGRIASATTVTVTRNEILAGFNKPDQFILAVVKVPESMEFGGSDVMAVNETGRYESSDQCEVFYVHEPFDQEPGFEVTSINFDLKKLLADAKKHQ